MTEGVKTAEEKAAEARRGPTAVRRGPHMAVGMPAEKSKDFGPSARRLLGLLQPERPSLTAVLALAVVSVALTAMGPRILGRATDLIFAGVIGHQLPATATKQQVVDGLRARGQDTFADMLSALDVVPRPGHRLRGSRPGPAVRPGHLRRG